ncbi:MAG: hypothetical protein ACPHL6_01055 [Rubripirellula sp.]
MKLRFTALLNPLLKHGDRIDKHQTERSLPDDAPKTQRDLLRSGMTRIANDWTQHSHGENEPNH